MREKTTITSLLLTAVLGLATPAHAATGDAYIAYNLGLAARAKGNIEAAYKLFKKSCLAQDGIAEACLIWSELAEGRGNEKDIKRALGSAVMLAPEDIRGRYALAMKLLKKEDWPWAIEHLSAALPHAKDSADRALLHYYLGYALFKNNALEEAGEHLAQTRPLLPPELTQRCNYFRAIIAKSAGESEQAVMLMKDAIVGADPAWSESARAELSSWSAFPARLGWFGQLSGSFGLNTRPLSVFVEDIIEANAALQSVFRADLLHNRGNETHAFEGLIIFYREQNWLELGDSPDGEEATDRFVTEDFNTTVFIAEGAYRGRTWISGLEHRLKIGVESSIQYMDNPPHKNEFTGDFERLDGSPTMVTRSLGGKIWWTMAPSKNALFDVRLKAEVRPNYIDRTMSSARFRLRLNHTRYALDRALQLKLLVGTRYDRTYHDSQIFKYDRLLPEAELNLRYKTPIERLTAVLGGQLKYNYYFNAKGNVDNSFRPPWNGELLAQQIDPATGQPLYTDAMLTALEAEYYDYARQDWEWELSGQAQLALWSRAVLSLIYRYHHRISNIDDAPSPLYENEDGQLARLQSPEYGYIRHQLMLELRQQF